MSKFLLFLSLLFLLNCSSGNMYRTEGVSKRDVHKKFSTQESTEESRIEAKGSVHYWICSYYGTKFHGKVTSNGEIFDMYKLTCAHKELPFDTKLKVTNEDNGKSVIVRVNDRGPFIDGRDLDLSYAAAKAIEMLDDGVKQLKIQILN